MKKLSLALLSALFLLAGTSLMAQEATPVTKKSIKDSPVKHEIGTSDNIQQHKYGTGVIPPVGNLIVDDNESYTHGTAGSGNTGGLDIFPVVATDYVRVRIPKTLRGPVNVTVKTLDGHIAKERIGTTDRVVQFDVSDLWNGVYVVQISGGGGGKNKTRGLLGHFRVE